MERRTFLSAGGASVLALTAGYTFASSPGDSSADSPTDVVAEYYRRASEADSQEQFTAAVPELAHSVSPLSELAESAPSSLDGALRQNLVETEVIAENIDAATIREISAFFAGSVSDEERAALAETNAVVAVTLESEDVVGGELAKEWLLAPEDGEWRLVWFDERNSPRAAVREFFRQVTRVEFSGQLDEPVDELTHPSSPLVNVAEYTPWYFRGIRRRELVGTEVTAEDIDTGDIASKFDPATNWPAQGPEEVAEENAVVAVTLRDDRLDVEEFEQEWLVATADDEWRVVWF